VRGEFAQKQSISKLPLKRNWKIDILFYWPQLQLLELKILRQIAVAIQMENAE
jgi:hypothetical protein